MKKIDKKTVLAIIFLILAISVVIVSNLINNNSKVEKAVILNDYNDFYTVDSCIYRTITYIGSKDSKSLLLVLNDNYKKKNNINANNVMNIFSNIEENTTFSSTKMFYQKINANLTKYYVEGYAENFIFDDDVTNTNEQKQKMYFIVYLDSKKSLFSIEPYNGEIFQGGEING